MDEVFYGGAARGGKSIALLTAALQYVAQPNYTALLLRKTYKDLALPGALMDVANRWLRGTKAEWNGTDYRWTFPSGASLTFGYLETENDKYRYQSSAFQFIAFDELSQFSESSYRYLFSRLTRVEGSHIPLRMRSASNPGGMGHEWVRNRFVHSVTPFVPSFHEDSKTSRMFVPARLEDNPHEDQEAYQRSLGNLDYVTRQQLRWGDWYIEPSGNLFKREWFKILAAIPAKVEGRCRFWDFAATDKAGDWTVGTLMSRTADGIYVIENVIRGQWSPGVGDRIMLQSANLDGTATKVREEQEPGSSGKRVIDSHKIMLAGYDYDGCVSTGEKITRWRPFSVQCEAGNVALVSGPWIDKWLAEMERVPQPSVHDDQADSAAGAFNELALNRPAPWRPISIMPKVQPENDPNFYPIGIW